MDSQNIVEINQSIAVTRKVVVAIGDSFTEGDELGPNGEPDPSKSFVNIVCNKYLNQEYTAINFGQSATGNFASVMRLFLHDVHWHLCEKIVVIFVPSAMHRFDVIADDRAFQVGNEFKTLWGYLPGHLSDTASPWREMHSGYGATIMSRQFCAINAILQFKVLNMWCHEHHAELIIFPAFDNAEYTREQFERALNEKIIRDQHSQKMKSETTTVNDKNYFINSVPWHKFVKIKDSVSFFDLCHRQESGYDPKKHAADYAVAGKISPDGWLMPRGHPSEKGHDLLAKELGQIIKTQ